MMITLTVSGIGYLVVCMCSGFFSYRLYQSYRRGKNQLSRYYARAFFCMAFMALSYALPTFFWAGSSLALSAGEFIGNAFLVLGFAHLIMIPFYVRYGSAGAQKGYYVALLWGLTLLFLTVINIPTLFFNEESILTKVYHPSLKVGYYAFIGGISFIIALTFFEQVRKSSGYARRRAFLLGLAFLFGGVGGGWVKVLEDAALLAVSFASLLIGFMLIFVASLYRTRTAPTGGSFFEEGTTVTKKTNGYIQRRA